MKTYSIAEVKAHMVSLVQQVVDIGEGIVIGHEERPMVQMVPYAIKAAGNRLGAFKGKIHLAVDFDDWDAEEKRGLRMN